MLGDWAAFCFSWLKGSHGAAKPLPDFLPWMHGWGLELEGEAKTSGMAEPVPAAAHLHITYYGGKQILSGLSHSECSFLLLAAKHIPNSHKYIVWIWFCPLEDPLCTIWRTKTRKIIHFYGLKKESDADKDLNTKLLTTVNYICIKNYFQLLFEIVKNWRYMKYSRTRLLTLYTWWHVICPL